jgi:acetoin utilization deacetylase AcuC-like enzyme
MQPVCGPLRETVSEQSLLDRIDPDGTHRRKRIGKNRKETVYNHTDLRPSFELPVYYSRAYTAARYEFDTTRKATWIADSLVERPIEGVRIIEPAPLNESQLATIHHPDYIEAVRTGTPRDLAESNGFDWDPGLWDAVGASNGGAVAAALQALRSGRNAGSLSSGLHHAYAGSGRGFCTFNGLALAARAVLEAGTRRVLIVDLDAHCGGGTYALTRGLDVHHLDISASAYDSYAPGDSRKATLDLVRDAREYLSLLRRRLADVDATNMELCIYNAGMDPYEGCSTGGLAGLSIDLLRQREAILFDWARDRGLPVAFVLAGGYLGGALDRDCLVDLHRLTVQAARNMCRAQRPGNAIVQ